MAANNKLTTWKTPNKETFVHLSGEASTFLPTPSLFHIYCVQIVRQKNANNTFHSQKKYNVTGANSRKIKEMKAMALCLFHHRYRYAWKAGRKEGSWDCGLNLENERLSGISDKLPHIIEY